MIGSPENPHHLDPDYGNIWKTVCGLGYNSANENLFEVANGVGYSGDIGTLMGREMDGSIGYGSRGFGGSYVSTNAYYFYSFSSDDQRREYSCYWPKYQKDSDAKRNREVMRNDIMNVKLGKWCFFWTADSYRSIAMTATSRTPTGINWILMRYSDLLLMFAEARYMLEKGTDSRSEIANMTAREALMAVRERAFKPGSPQVNQYDSDFFNAIVNERAWELGGEGIRKLDLIRWGLLDTKIEAMKKAMLYMMDGTHTVTCMDKTYEPSDFPQTLYYQYDANNEYIDWETATFYRNYAANPYSGNKAEIKWFPANYWDLAEGREGSLVDNSVKVLLCASGLRKSYDYSQLLADLKYGAQIQAKLNQYQLGNGLLNYRHFFSIHYDDIYKSKGYLKNSYGYDKQL